MDTEQRLENIEKLLALNLVEEKSDLEAIKILYKLDYSSTEIGEIIGLADSTVRNKKQDLKEAGEIE